MEKSAFNLGDFVVYPAHGLGQITDIEKEVVAGQNIEFLVIRCDKDQLVLRVPLVNAHKVGLRRLVSPQTMDNALDILKGKAKIKNSQWGKRSQEYTVKIYSGDPLAVAEVLRDLYKDPDQQGFGERQLFDEAKERFVAEFALVNKIKKGEAFSRLESILQNRLIVAK